MRIPRLLQAVLVLVGVYFGFIVVFDIILEAVIPASLIIMYMFFATIGAGTELAVLMETGLMIFALAATMLLVHATITLLAAKVLRFDLATVAIASFACVGGPAPPAAVAAARGWHTLTTPAIMCGVLGYAIANFLGVAVAKFLA